MIRCFFIDVEFIKYNIVHKFTVKLQYYIPIVVFSFTLYIPMYVIIRGNTNSTKKLYQKNKIVYIIHSLEIEITFRRIQNYLWYFYFYTWTERTMWSLLK